MWKEFIEGDSGFENGKRTLHPGLLHDCRDERLVSVHALLSAWRQESFSLGLRGYGQAVAFLLPRAQAKLWLRGALLLASLRCRRRCWQHSDIDDIFDLAQDRRRK